MPTINLTGDFNYITQTVQKIKSISNALFKADTASLNQLIDDNRLGFTSTFRGDFDYTDNSGALSELKMTLLDYSTRDYLIIIEFERFSAPFSDVFNVGTSSFSYDESGWLSVVMLGGYTINGSDENDRVSGGKGADMFVFGPGKMLDTVTGFAIGTNRIDVRTATELSELRLIDKLDGTLMRDGLHKMFLQGVDADDLSARDFLF